MSLIVDRWFAEYRSSTRHSPPREFGELAGANAPESDAGLGIETTRAAGGPRRDGAFWMRLRRWLVGPRWDSARRPAPGVTSGAGPGRAGPEARAARTRAPDSTGRGEA
jgi:hypothetical protein